MCVSRLTPAGRQWGCIVAWVIQVNASRVRQERSTPWSKRRRLHSSRRAAGRVFMERPLQSRSLAEKPVGWGCMPQEAAPGGDAVSCRDADCCPSVRKDAPARRQRVGGKGPDSCSGITPGMPATPGRSRRGLAKRAIPVGSWIFRMSGSVGWRKAPDAFAPEHRALAMSVADGIGRHRPFLKRKSISEAPDAGESYLPVYSDTCGWQPLS